MARCRTLEGTERHPVCIVLLLLLLFEFFFHFQFSGSRGYIFKMIFECESRDSRNSRYISQLTKLVTDSRISRYLSRFAKLAIFENYLSRLIRELSLANESRGCSQ
jgi:hypothetical protein